LKLVADLVKFASQFYASLGRTSQ